MSLRDDIKTALQRSYGWPHDLHPGPAADAILSIPGYRLVPVEPTPEMVEAGWDETPCHWSGKENLLDAYRAMLAASPDVKEGG